MTDTLWKWPWNLVGEKTQTETMCGNPPCWRHPARQIITFLIIKFSPIPTSSLSSTKYIHKGDGKTSSLPRRPCRTICELFFENITLIHDNTRKIFSKTSVSKQLLHWYFSWLVRNLCFSNWPYIFFSVWSCPWNRAQTMEDSCLSSTHPPSKSCVLNNIK